VRVTQSGDRVDNVRTELWAAPGLVAVGALYDHETRRFATPLQRYNFPLKPGESWNQWVDNVNESAQSQGAINRYVVVDGWERVATPAGSFNAIRLRVLMRLDDGEFWRGPTTCSDVVWYAPEARRSCAPSAAPSSSGGRPRLRASLYAALMLELRLHAGRMAGMGRESGIALRAQPGLRCGCGRAAAAAIRSPRSAPAPVGAASSDRLHRQTHSAFLVGLKSTLTHSLPSR
jgi:hypothetical protein